MMIAWKANPRWTTAHNIYKKMRQELQNANVEFTIPLDFIRSQNLPGTFNEKHIVSAWASHPGYIANWDDLVVAYALAWQVFFNLHVMEYERKKREENGDVV